MRTERVTFLTSRDHKAALDAFAAQSGQSVGHVVREATARYIAEGEDEEAELAALVTEVNKAIPKMQASIESMIDTLRKTREEVDESLRSVGFRK